MLPFRARVDLGVMVTKVYSAFPKAPALLEPDHQIVQCHILDTCRESLSPLVGMQSVYSLALANRAHFVNTHTHTHIYIYCLYICIWHDYSAVAYWNIGNSEKTFAKLHIIPISPKNAYICFKYPTSYLELPSNIEND